MKTFSEQINDIRGYITDNESISISGNISTDFLVEYFSRNKVDVINDCTNAIQSIMNMSSKRKTEYSLSELIARVETFQDISENHTTYILDIKSLVQLHSFYRIKVLSKPKEIEVKTIEKLNELLSSQRANSWYRGHSDSSWELVPSLFRDIKDKHIDFNYDKMLYDLQQKKVIEKLEVVFGSSDFDYDKLAYTQHSLGYGPLLDFTKSSKVAFSFALSNMENIAKFFHKKFCVYELDTAGISLLRTKDEIGTALKSLNITVFSGKPQIETILRTPIWQGLLDGSIESEVFLLDNQTNDRMRYQKGAFMLFNNVIIIGGRMIMSFRKQMTLSQRMTKYLISEDQRLAFYNLFMNQCPEYKIRFLMDPYNFFKE